MVIAMLDVNIKPGREEEFKAWAAESNGIISKFDGFVSRRLLQGSDGSLRMMVEFDSEEKFAAMRRSQEHQSVHRRASDLLAGPPVPVMYRVVAG